MSDYDKKRDIEKEREELLQLIGKNVSKELKEEIYNVFSIVHEPELPQITVSYEGACNANEG